MQSAVRSAVALLYNAGSYADIVHGHALKSKIRMLLTVKVNGLPAPVDLRLTFASDPADANAPRMVDLLIRGGESLPVEFRRGRGAGGPYKMLIGEKEVGEEEKGNFFFPVNGILPRVGTFAPNQPATYKQARTQASHTLREFSTFLRTFKAVGAFRHRPERRYEYQGRVSNVVDPTGRQAPFALFEDAISRRNPGRLAEAVNEWLASVGRVKILPVKPMAKGLKLFDLRVKDTVTGQWANFADVGFGIGQALPVIVQGLLTPRRGLYIVQEPEIHLHPDAQLVMANFLAHLVNSGRRVIVETHSEHLLLRLRNLVLEGSTKRRANLPYLDADQLSLLYVDNAKGGSSHVEKMGIDELGRLKDWPKNFMEEATKERMDILQKQADKIGAGDVE